MKIKPFIIEKNTSISWDDIFKKPAHIKINSFKTGSVSIDLKGTLNPDHPNSPMLDGVIDIPIMAHLISHQKFGDFLLDTGLDRSYYGDIYGGVEAPLKEEFIQGENENIGCWLKDEGSELVNIFLSHIHPDHAAGLRDINTGIPVVVGKGELENYQPKMYGNFLEDVETVYEIDFTNLNNIYPFGKCADLLGDGSLWAVSTPGHTVGHISFVVNGFPCPTLLTMDAAFIPENIQYGVAPSDYTWNVAKAQKSLDQIILFLKMFKEVKIITGHETPLKD